LAAEENGDGDNHGGYAKFWNGFSRFIKEGIATDRESLDNLPQLLRFHTLNQPEKLVSLDAYIRGFQPDQKKIYYILADDDRAAVHSPHLDIFRKAGVDVLLMTDPLDPFVLIALTSYKDFPLANAAVEKPETKAVDETASNVDEPQLPEDILAGLVQRFKDALGDRVSDVRITDRLVDSPARLVDPEGAMNQEMQRAYRLMRQEFDAPQKVLEINPRHPILKRLGEQASDPQINAIIIEQIYEDALLIEGLHPNPAAMVQRIQELMKAALK
jgi:molecular chaperone HtpG